MVQILINLIDNSIKFGREAAEKHILLRVAPKGKYMNISVSDTGPGIDPAALKKVFDDFYREDNSLTRKTKGTGIGLALVKKFVLAMGGKVTASNNRDAGCKITISLPLGNI
jgi:signal transduction histidine kinase